jgi:SH3-like domain-containing protein
MVGDRRGIHKTLRGGAQDPGSEADMTGWGRALVLGLALLAAPVVAQEGPVNVQETAAAPRDPSRGAVTNLPLPRYVTLKGSEGNARRGPSLTHRIDWVFTRPGMPLKVTAEFEHWRRVEDSEGAGGWVHYALLSGTRAVLVTEDMVEIRARPDDAAEPVLQAEYGVIARLQECSVEWCRISADGTRGWVRKTSLWGVDPGEIIE